MRTSTRPAPAPLRPLAIVLLAVASLAPAPARAQDAQEPAALGDVPTQAPEGIEGRPTFSVQPLGAGEIAVDGRLDEAVWDAPPTFTLDYETYPGDNVAPPVETEFWITHDDGHLYIGVRAHDTEPEKIRARLRDRDSAFQDDFVGVVLDTFNDERRGFEFFVNPLGVQMDLIQNDVTGQEDSSWDTLWDSAGRLTETGYEVEMAIPFSSLRFVRGDGPKTWGVDAVRNWPRDQRRRIGLNALPRGRNCYLCHASKLYGFAGVSPGRALEVTPTLTANDSARRRSGGERFTESDAQELGVTAHWGITPGTTLSGTINPDFSQVEADAAQLDVNTQFALFFPEKRPFFLEGGDLFQTQINAVYTRTIADPAWGAKLTGKSGKSAYGAIVAEDERTNLVIPGSQGSRFASLDQENTSSVLRYRRDLPGSSSIGGLITSRVGDGYESHLIGMDSLFRWGEGDAFRLEVLGSETEYPAEIRSLARQPDGDPLRGTAVRAAYQHNTRDWMGYVRYDDVTDDFRADLGFIPKAGYRTGFALYERRWYREEGGEQWWSQLTGGVETTWSYEQNGDPLQQQFAIWGSVNGPRESFVNVFAAVGPSWFRGREFDRNLVNFYGQVQATPNVQLTLETRLGQEIDYANARDGDIVRLVPRVRLDLGRHLRVNASHNYEALDVAGGRLYTANLSDLRATYQINVRTFVRVVSQFFDIEREPDLYTFETDEHRSDLFNQLLFAYKVNPQTVLFLGYADDYRGFARSLDELDQTSRTLFLKVGYAWVL